MPYKQLKATEKHLPELVEIIKQHAGKDEILPRDADSIRKNLEFFRVVTVKDKVIACAAYRVYSKDLAEIRSVVVTDSYQGQGIGKNLIHFVEDAIRQEQIGTSFVLTRSVLFFKKMGYHIVKKEMFPQKIWNDCSNCPHIDDCDETAMLKCLQD